MLAMAFSLVSVPSPLCELGRRPPLPRRRCVVVAGKLLTGPEVSVDPQPPSENGFSRRAAMVCLAASLVASISAVSPAEARRIKPETIRKIREKLEKMKKKADSGAGGSKEKPPLPPPSLNDLAGPLVEITL